MYGAISSELAQESSLKSYEKKKKYLLATNISREFVTIQWHFTESNLLIDSYCV